MSKTWKKMLALLLAICAVVSLAVPTVSAAEENTATEEEYVFPEFGKEYLLGEPLLGELSITEYALKVEKDGKEFLMCPAKGGTLYAFKLTDFVNGDFSSGTWIECSVNDYIGIPRGIVQDSKGYVYVIGDSASVFVYDFYTGNSWQIPIPNSGANGISIDENDNVYVSNRGVVVKIDTNNGNKVTTFFDASDIFQLCMANAVGDGYLYVCGGIKGAPNGMEIYKIDLATGKSAGKATFNNCGGMYYLSYIDGVVFAGHSAAHNEGMIAVDVKTMQEIDIGVDRWLMGVVTNPKDGKSYMQVNGIGIHEYDLATRKATPVEGLTAVGINLRIRDPYVNMTYENVSGEAMMTMASGGAMPTLMSLTGQGFVQMETLVEEATSPADTRCIVAGIPGLEVIDPEKMESEDVLEKTAAEVAVYIGAYLSGGVGRYSPDLEEADRLENRVFSNGHAQTDSLTIYKNKLYAGCYSGAYLVEFDPVAGTTRELIPDGLKDAPYEQARIHSISCGDDKVFFSTVPSNTGGKLGGCIGWYDLKTDELYVERNVVQDQILISIHYDEKTGLLYGASSISGGTGAIPVAKEAVLLVYDTKTKTKLGEFSVRAGVNPNSDMVWDLEAGAAIPRYIAGIAQDPDTGKYWGLASNTLFSFEYDRASNTMKVHEELAVGSSVTNQKGRYQTGGSLQWFPRPFCFDGKGNMYISFEAVGYLRRVSTANPSDNVVVAKKGGRIYCIGADGNLYITSGTYLYTVALDRVSIVKNMIHYTEPRDLEGAAEARKAYNALTEEEKAELTEEDHAGLAALEGAVDIFREVAAERAMDAIDAIGAITATTAAPLLEARRAYEALDEQSRPMVTNYDDLVAAEAAYAEICSKTSYGPAKRFELKLSNKGNRTQGVGLQAVTYDHITGGLWEYAMGSGSASAMKFNGGDHIQLNFGSENTGYFGIRVRVNEAGTYDLTMQTKAYNGCLAGIYIFEDNGMMGDAFEMPIRNELDLRTAYTDHFVGFADFTVEGTQSVGTWNCETPGEYILVISRLAAKDGVYARIMNIAFTAKSPIVDPVVELAKDRINAIGKVTKKSGTAINDARITYDALTDAQKALIYAPVLEKAEKAYAEIAAKAAVDEAAAAVVDLQISAIGEVTVGSGEAIKAAREAFDALTKDQKKLVTNEKVLKDAEKAYKELTAPAGGDDAGDKDNTMTVVIIVVVAVVVIGAVVVVLVLGGKKKKKAVAPAAEEPAEEAPTVDEILDK